MPILSLGRHAGLDHRLQRGGHLRPGVGLQMRQGRGDAPHANLFVVPHHFLTTFGQLQTPHAAVASLGDAVDQLGPLQPVGKLRHRAQRDPQFPAQRRHRPRSLGKDAADPQLSERQIDDGIIIGSRRKLPQQFVQQPSGCSSLFHRACWVHKSQSAKEIFRRRNGNAGNYGQLINSPVPLIYLKYLRVSMPRCAPLKTEHQVNR